MSDDEIKTTGDDKLDHVASLAYMVSHSIECLVRGEKITPDEAIRSVASALWATVVAYSAPEHFEANSAFAVETFGAFRDAATKAQKELEFDEQYQGHQWGTA